MAHVDEFHATWSALERKLRAHLARRGVPASWRDDVVQDTSIRLFRVWHRVDADADLYPLARVIATRVLCDEARHHRETLVAEPSPESTDVSAEVAAIARLELRLALELVDRLTPAERSAVLAEIGAADRPETVTSAFKMARMRGRRNLRALMEDAALGFAPLRSLASRLQRRLDSLREPGLVSQIVASGTQVTSLIGMSVLIGTAPPPLPAAPNVHRPAQGATIRVAAFDGKTETLARDAEQRRGREASAPLHASPAAARGQETLSSGGRRARSGQSTSTNFGSSGASVDQRDGTVAVWVCPGDVTNDDPQPCDESSEGSIGAVVGAGSGDDLHAGP